ncbi:twin-arginine translocase subunit TatC [Raineya orbicola]|uniref:Sec-independent protein translocase protein TatC n=1 Tax=Raineya orbicola TaxID=2016530 RepID=A0A2N3IKQ2_9BACT|nr:twin-arginine translocase subunit TatC [Raineya orbicola]PKQ70897.1 tatC: twin arginine-targeting protein translocase TatC [Raineya orbicola]
MASKAEKSEMTFLEHLEVLRKHLVRSVIVVVVLMIVAFGFTEFIFEEVLFGPAKADFWTYRKMCELGRWLGSEGLCVGVNLNFVNFTITGQFMTHITSAIVIGLVLGFPYIVWEIWRFVKPALYEKELKATKGVVFYIALLFVVGVLFGYFILTPISVNFLATYKISSRINPNLEFDLHSYVSIVTWLTLISALMFQLPMVAYFLGKVGLLTASFMRSYRRHSIVGVLILAAIITPTGDIFSQLIVALPLYVLYEASIFIVARVEKSEKELEKAQEIQYTQVISPQTPAPRLDQMLE